MWAARGLRYAWTDDPDVHRAVRAALADDAWRVREHAADLVRLHEVADAAPGLRPLLVDDVPRVRAAAAAALVVVGEHDDLVALASARDVDEEAVAALAARLDVPDPRA